MTPEEQQQVNAPSAEPVVTVTMDQLMQIIGQKETERMLLMQQVAQLRQKVAELTKKEPPKGEAP